MVLVIAVVRRRENCDARRILLLLIPHMELEAVAFFLVRPDQGLKLFFLKNLLQNGPTKLD